VNHYYYFNSFNKIKKNRKGVNQKSEKRNLLSLSTLIINTLASVIKFTAMSHYYFFWQLWLATVQEVLQADWQEVWHSPHPPSFILSFNVFPFNV
jgi:hypothetical protein